VEDRLIGLTDDWAEEFCSTTHIVQGRHHSSVAQPRWAREK
jgi:hypothetical protein